MPRMFNPICFWRWPLWLGTKRAPCPFFANICMSVLHRDINSSTGDRKHLSRHLSHHRGHLLFQFSYHDICALNLKRLLSLSGERRIGHRLTALFLAAKQICVCSMCIFNVLKDKGRNQGRKEGRMDSAWKWMRFWMQVQLRGWGASLPVNCLGLAIRVDSQATTPSDDPRLTLAAAQLAPEVVQVGWGGGGVCAATAWRSH